MINWNLARTPINWAIVFLMLLIVGIAGSLTLRLTGVIHATGASPSDNTLSQSETMFSASASEVS